MIYASPPLFLGHYERAVPLEAAKLASSEAELIWNYQEITIGKISIGRLVTKSGIEVTCLYPQDADDTESLREIAPNLTATVLNMSAQHTRTPGTLPRSIAINVMSPGQVQPAHLDNRSGLTRVVNLQSSGTFHIRNPFTGEITSLNTEAGDVHEFWNPEDKNKQPLHWGENTSDQIRKIIAFTLK